MNFTNSSKRQENRAKLTAFLLVIILSILIGIISGLGKSQWVLAFVGITFFTFTIMYSTFRIQLLVSTLLIAFSFPILDQSTFIYSLGSQTKWTIFIFIAGLLFLLAFIKSKQAHVLILRRLLPYLAYLLFLGFSILSIFKAVDTLLSLQVIMIHFILVSIAFIALPILISTLTEFKTFILVSWLIFATFTIVSLISWIIDPDMAVDNQGRIKGIFFNPNYTANYAYIAIVLAFAYIQTVRIRKYRFFAIVIAILSAFVLLLTLSRGAWISVIIAILFVVFRQKKLKNFIWPVLGIGIVFSLLFQSTYVNFDALLTKRLEFNTVTNRVDLWQTAIDLWRNNLWLGIGRGMSELSGEFLSSANIETRPHGFIFQLLAETGFFGTIAFIIFMLTSFLQVSRHKLHSQINTAKFVEGINDRKFMIWIEGATLGYLVHELFENNLLAVGNAYNIFFWLVIGWLVVISYMRPFFDHASEEQILSVSRT